MHNKSFSASMGIGLVLLLLALVVTYYLFFLAPASPEVGAADGTSEIDSQATTDVSMQLEGQVVSSDEPAAASGFALSAAQVDALVSLGVDSESVPERVSAAQEACFVDTLGQERVEEVKAGAVPNAMELMRAQSCI